MNPTAKGRQNYKLHATDAAEAERKGNYDTAACHWSAAVWQAPNQIEQHWAQSRMEFCTKQSNLEVTSL